MNKEFKIRPYPILTDKDHAHIIEMSLKGCGFFEIASDLDIDMPKLAKMRLEDPKLNETLTMAHTHAGGWWEAMMRKNVKNESFTNTTLVIARMNNCYGWGATPSQRTNPMSAMPEWRGNVEEKIDYLDYLLREKKICVEVYEHLIKSLESHCKINEICYIKPQLEKMEIESKFSAGEINEVQFKKEMELWEEARRVREIAVERILKKEKIISHNKIPQQRKVKKVNKIKK